MEPENDNIKQEKLEKIAKEVMLLSRNTLLVNMRFLDAAINQFILFPTDYDSTLLTDGKHLIYNPKRIIRNYKSAKEIPVRDYLHVILHCVFQHMYGAPNLDRPVWDLACDIAVEYSISEMNLAATTTARQTAQQEIYDQLKKELKYLTAEKIYRYYKEKGITEKKLALLRGSFYADNHEIWYWTIQQINVIIGVSSSSSSDDEQDDSDGQGKGQGKNGDSDDDGQNNGQSGNGDGDGDGEDDGEDGYSQKGKQSKIWKDIAEHMQMDMETFSKRAGNQAGNMLQNLKEVTREKYDYTSFLKKFAVMNEAMKINDDEFDYIFYTYGLSLYKDVPLVEPLEYKDIKQIKEFVIAIDTSGSTSGELVQAFVQKTYNILKSSESFSKRVNIHIIQCDTEIQEHVKITTQEEFDEYMKKMKIHGLGGTDFRPVFSFVDELIRAHEFTNLKGLLYFTDGYGDFPGKKTPYETAFVFIDDEENNYDIPPWAIKLVLTKEELGSLKDD